MMMFPSMMMLPSRYKRLQNAFKKGYFKLRRTKRALFLAMLGLTISEIETKFYEKFFGELPGRMVIS